jgi:hypothetical protein
MNRAGTIPSGQVPSSSSRWIAKIIFPPERQLYLAGPSEGHMSNIHENVMSQTAEQRDDAVVPAFSCPVLDCGSLVIGYRPADSVLPGHPEDFEFTCSRCGTEFAAAEGELIFQSIPKRWLSANMLAA